MAVFSSYENGQFSWIDLMSRDMVSAASFYENLFGWVAQPQDTQDGPPYSIFQLEGKHVAGLGEMNDGMRSSGAPPVWSSYVSVDDLAATVERVTSLGGTIAMPPMQVTDAGSMAIIQDSQGAFLSLWQRGLHHGAEITNVPNTWVWNELMCVDTKAATRFYQDLFGWEAKLDPTADRPYWGFEVNGRLNGGMMQLTPEMGEIPPNWCVYFAVSDIRLATSKLASLGGKLLRPAFEVNVGHIAICCDPQGAVFNMIQMTVPVDE